MTALLYHTLIIHPCPTYRACRDPVARNVTRHVGNCTLKRSWRFTAPVSHHVWSVQVGKHASIHWYTSPRARLTARVLQAPIQPVIRMSLKPLHVSFKLPLPPSNRKFLRSFTGCWSVEPFCPTLFLTWVSGCCCLWRWRVRRWWR